MRVPCWQSLSEKMFSRPQHRTVIYVLTVLVKNRLLRHADACTNHMGCQVGVQAHGERPRQAGQGFRDKFNDDDAYRFCHNAARMTCGMVGYGYGLGMSMVWHGMVWYGYRYGYRYGMGIGLGMYGSHMGMVWSGRWPGRLARPYCSVLYGSSLYYSLRAWQFRENDPNQQQKRRQIEDPRLFDNLLQQVGFLNLIISGVFACQCP